MIDIKNTMKITKEVYKLLTIPNPDTSHRCILS